MGRKTNSVSLRLKKTNKDFNDCWYGDVLYSENLSKSLKIKSHLSQTLKSAAVPCAHLSLIGAFKKSNILVGYLDPEPTRKQRCESFYLKMYPRLPDNQRSAEVLLQSKYFPINSKPNTLLCHLGQARPPTVGFHVASLANSYLCKESTAKKVKIAEQKANCKDNHLQTLLPNLYTDSSMASESQSFIFAGNIAESASLGLVVHSKAALEDTKSTVEGKSLGITRQYKCYTPFPGNSLQSNLPEKFISMFYKPASEKYSFPIYNIFPLIGFLCSVKIFKYYRETEYTLVNNKTLHWFSQRKSFFCYLYILYYLYAVSKDSKEGKECRTEISSQPNVAISDTCKTIAFAAKIAQQKQGAEIARSLFTYSRRLFLESNYTDVGPQSVYFENKGSHLKRLLNMYSGFWGNFLCISLYKSVSENSSALFLANSIAYYLERRVQFRRLKRQLLLELSTLAVAPAPAPAPAQRARARAGAGAQLPILQGLCNTTHGYNESVSMFDKNISKIAGIRVSCSGRVGGRSKKAQRSRKETLMWGETGLHVFSSKLDFARTHAETGFGLVGIQVWICYK